ncbi:MAG: hypothetical protein WCL16_01630, partial [bacterium]
MKRPAQSPMPPRDTRHKQGAALGIVLIVLLVLSLLGFQLIALSGRDAVETAKEGNTTRAFWAAEGGLHHARAMLRLSSAFRAAPWTLTGTGMTYSANTIIVANDIYTIVSTGTASTASRVAQQTLVVKTGWPSAFDYLLYGGGGSMTFAKNETITGNLFQNGDVSFASGVEMTGTVYATGTVSGYPGT